jgi:hypothetical protein
MDFNTQWAALLTRMPASGSRLKLVLSPSTDQEASS